jgi:hypothetical protein
MEKEGLTGTDLTKVEDKRLVFEIRFSFVFICR